MSVETPFFSITIPSYNRGYILPETIQSIQEQSFFNWEVIIVDDGSTDNTRDVISQLSEKDNRIRYVYQNNAERSAARNNGTDHARGNYLLFLDSDDKYSSGHLEKIFQFIIQKQEPIALFFTNVSYLTSKGIESPNIPSMQIGGEFNYLLLNPITPSRVCIHRNILSEFRFDPQIVIVEDLVLWVSIATKFPVFQVPVNTLLYRIHDGNSVDLSRNSYLDRYKGLNRLFKDSDYSKVSSRIPLEIKKLLLAECSFNMARHYEYVKNWSMMNQMLFQSFRHLTTYRNKERLFMFLSHFQLTASFVNKKHKNES
jgi:glycosyltransferase involved in cell wall biosynthesis